MLPLWLTHTFLALLGFSGIYIFITLLTRGGLHPITLNFWFFLLTAIGFYILSLFMHQSLSVPSKHYGLLAGLIIVAVFGNLFSVYAYASAPNAAYATAIISTATVALALFSYVFLAAPFSALKFIGIILSVVGVILISFGSTK
ncbi:MAG: hypothetical protein COY40_05760 [Alphaproteobacteria bacterium CG_4_10_14_0_8_um_filter_53_9]|nr:MAG: hypothetical protein COY40_05760 [Alphaproteobacteria bacterium CG_4_10_14_0_8_um_filter_53_9]